MNYTTVKKSERSKVMATKHQIESALNRRREGAPKAVETATGGLISDPTEVAKMAETFGGLRGNDAQPHWSLAVNVAKGHKVWYIAGDGSVEAVAGGTVTDVTNNCTFQIQDDRSGAK